LTSQYPPERRAKKWVWHPAAPDPTACFMFSMLTGLPNYPSMSCAMVARICGDLVAPSGVFVVVPVVALIVW
jgi:hypothetical protein